MGCYNSVLLLEGASDSSIVLPKLCAAIEVTTPVSRPFVSMTIRAYFNDELLGELSVSPEQMAAVMSAGANPHIAEPIWHAVNAFMTFAPLVVSPSGGKLRIEVETEEGMLNSNSLMIVVNASTASDTSAPAATAQEALH